MTTISLRLPPDLAAQLGQYLEERQLLHSTTGKPARGVLTFALHELIRAGLFAYREAASRAEHVRSEALGLPRPTKATRATTAVRAERGAR